MIMRFPAKGAAVSYLGILRRRCIISLISGSCATVFHFDVDPRVGKRGAATAAQFSPEVVI